MTIVKGLVKSALHSTFSYIGLLRLRMAKKPTLVILTYHRILPTESPLRNTEQPGMVASPETLRSHIELFQSLNASFVHLDEWVRKRKAGETLPKLAVALTFDDGWQDNYSYAFPLLEKYRVPATIFLVSQYLNTNRVFWPERVIELSRLEPSSRPPEINEWLKQYAAGTPFSERGLSVEEADGLVNNLKSLDDNTILSGITLNEAPHPSSSRLILNNSELREMASSGLVRFGAHTREHFRLNMLLDQASLEDEIVLCKSELESLNIGPISLFCYPNGDITDKGEHLVSGNYLGACTTQNGLNDTTTPVHNLKRFNFHDGNGRSRRLSLSTIGRSLFSS